MDYKINQVVKYIIIIVVVVLQGVGDISLCKVNNKLLILWVLIPHYSLIRILSVINIQVMIYNKNNNN